MILHERAFCVLKMKTTHTYLLAACFCLCLFLPLSHAFCQLFLIFFFALLVHKNEQKIKSKKKKEWKKNKNNNNVIEALLFSTWALISLPLPLKNWFWQVFFVSLFSLLLSGGDELMDEDNYVMKKSLPPGNVA